MSGRHTPGPWVVNPVAARVDCGAPSKLGGLLPVAQMLWPTEERSEDETAANARLIAASPDVLSILIVCRDQFDFYAREHRKAEKHDKAATNERFAFLATQAINRATGAA